jgi:Formiminotransferase-cyclodeaminase.
VSYQFTEELMSKAPTPGGGGTAALIGSLAAAPRRHGNQSDYREKEVSPL